MRTWGWGCLRLVAHQEPWWFYCPTDLRIAKEVQTIEVYKHEVRRECARALFLIRPQMPSRLSSFAGVLEAP